MNVMRWKWLGLGLLAVVASCNQRMESDQENTELEVEAVTESTLSGDRELTEDFNNYWNNGTAEISSYELNQARYGEMREGSAVYIFVTEPFDPEDQIKADKPNDENVPVLKLNATKDFVTGIYPYHVMSSTFLPLDKDQNAIKVAGSIQEWCGQTYMQLNRNNDSYQGKLHSYFQSEGNRDFALDNQMLENQIPIQLRLDPKAMPTGELQVIPSVEFLRLKHIEAQPLNAVAKLREMEDGYVYSVVYKDIDRTIAFKTEKTHPYRILSWMDRYNDSGKPMVSTGTLKKTIQTAYWGKNANEDRILRDSLAL